MVREKLYVTVPSLFKCPISMDVMRSPVSLCTGVTYDRSSIQDWLDSGHDTCPATMQILPSKDFVPNLTLRRLINLWLSGESSPLASPSSLTSKHCASTVPIEHVGTLIHSIQNDNEDVAGSLSKIVEFVNHSGENRRFLANFPGFDVVIVRTLRRKSSEISVSEKVVRILHSIMRENEVKERIRGLIFNAPNRDCLSWIISILENGGTSSKIESARILESLATDVQLKRSIIETQGLLSVLFSLLLSETESSAELNDAVLSFLTTVSVAQSTKSRLVQLGLVQVLRKMLLNSTSSNANMEKCLKLLATVASCAEGRAAIGEELPCVAAMVDRMVKASREGTEDAVVVLWSLCCLCKNIKVQDEVVKKNGVTKILLVMQRDSEEHVRKMCADLVKVLRSRCKDGLGSYDTKTTHIKPC